jgi:DNA-binding response OmpR family regulator
MAVHMIAPRSLEGLDRVPLRRPRFSNAEVVILNMLINANGETVQRKKLALATGVMEESVHAYIGMLRVKLGEPRYAPKMIITTWPCEENDYQTGWRWIEPS